MTDDPIRERVAHQFALELQEATAVDRLNWKWPDDFVGDTIDRARCAADAALRECGYEEMRRALEQKEETVRHLRNVILTISEDGHALAQSVVEAYALDGLDLFAERRDIEARAALSRTQTEG